MLNIHYNRIFCKITWSVFVEMGRERPLCPALQIEQLHLGQGRCGMKRRFEGLHQTDQSAGHNVPDGLFLVRVQRAQYRWHPQKPFYHLRFVVLEPQQFEGRPFGARVYCSSKALWKLAWFLHDFGYDADLLAHDEVDDKNLVRLRSVVKISHTVLNGTTLLNFDGFAPASQWGELAILPPAATNGPEAAR